MNLGNITKSLRHVLDSGIVVSVDGEWRKVPYSKFYEDVVTAEKILLSYGVRERMLVGICASNCYEWLVYDFALINMNCVSVVFPAEVYGKRSLLDIKIKFGLNLVIADADADAELISQAKFHWLTPLTLTDSDARRNYFVDHEKSGVCVDDDVFTLVFSSGTSGKQKCLAINRSGMESVLEGFDAAFNFNQGDSIIAFSSLSIFQQRWMLYAASSFGFDFLLVEYRDIFRALPQLRPSIMGAPPIFYEVIENRFSCLPFAHRAMYRVLGSLCRLLPKSIEGSARAVVFRKFHMLLGDGFRLMLIGAAPPKISTLKFFRMAGLPLYEGYGMTETGYLTVNLPGSNRIGSVGRPFPNVSIELGSDGEVIARLDKPLCQSYVFDLDETEKTILPNNRISTGDIGRFDSDGYLYITGRKKEIIITTGGVKVHPETLEREIESKCSSIVRAFVYGGENVSGLGVLLSVKIKPTDKSKFRYDKIISDVNSRMPPGSKITSMKFTSEEFTSKNGFLTRSMKLNRREIRNKLVENSL